MRRGCRDRGWGRGTGGHLSREPVFLTLISPRPARVDVTAILLFYLFLYSSIYTVRLFFVLYASASLTLFLTHSAFVFCLSCLSLYVSRFRSLSLSQTTPSLSLSPLYLVPLSPLSPKHAHTVKVGQIMYLSNCLYLYRHAICHYLFISIFFFTNIHIPLSHLLANSNLVCFHIYSNLSTSV